MHLKLNYEGENETKISSFELGASEVMPQDNHKLVYNLLKLLIEQDKAINELLEIEEGL